MSIETSSRERNKMMRRIYERAKTLPDVLPQEIVERCLNAAWPEYLKDLGNLKDTPEDPEKTSFYLTLPRR